MPQEETWTLNPEAAARFAALGRREVERRLIDLAFSPGEDWQANLWLSAVREWTDLAFASGKPVDFMVDLSTR